MSSGSRTSGFLRRLKADSRGATVIEFAFFAPMVGLLVVGIADYGRGFSERFALESAAHAALERASAGNISKDYTFLKKEAADAAGVPVENVTLDNWLECDGKRMSNYDGVCTADQEVARYLYIKLTKNYQPSFRWTGGGKIIPISGDAAVRIQ